jgi:hypothetical protein
MSLTIPSNIVTLTTATVYYVVASCTFSAGTCSAYGSIIATRIG